MKISDMNNTTEISGEDLLIINHDSSTKNVKVSDFLSEAAFLYATSATTSSTAEKVVTTATENIIGSLAAGLKIAVLFTEENTAESPTLNVNSLGACNIVAYGTTAPNLYWKAGEIVRFTFDGTSWVMAPTQYQVEIVNQDSAASHNTIFAGRYLGNSVTDEQYAQIQAGTFRDLYVGDYWTINDVNYRIAAFDFWLHDGDTECTTHHAVIVPDSNLDTQAMNSTNTTSGGYIGSAMYTTNMATAKNTIIAAFTSDHILNHRELLTNAISTNSASNWAWYDSTIELMNETMVYGHEANSSKNDGALNYNVGIDKTQLPLFRMAPELITNRANWWLRSVVSSAHFALVAGTGDANASSASASNGVRPCFAIC